MKKAFNYTKKYPILFGLFILAVLSLFLLGVWYQQRNATYVTTLIPDELAREATVDGYGDPKEIVRYFYTALAEGDLDKGLRGTPIDERLLGMNLGDLIASEGMFSNSYTVAASGSYEEYIPLSSAELTEEYAVLFQTVRGELVKLPQAKLKRVDYVNSREQMSKAYRGLMQEKADYWGAKALCEVVALVESEGDTYALGFTLARYYDYWKVFSVGGELADFGQGDSCIYPITEQEYEALLTQEDDPALEERLSEDIETDKEEADVPVEEALLPPNYCIVATLGGETPQKAVEAFSLSLNKGDFLAAMNYGVMDCTADEVANVTTERIQAQGEFAKEIKYFCYNLQGNQYGLENQPLTQIGESGREIVESLDVSNIPFLELLGVFPVDKTEKTPKEYAAVYSYGKAKYIAGFTVQETSFGWQIQSLSAHSANLNEGDVRKITEKEAKEILERRSLH